MTPEGVFFCWQGGTERDFVNSAKIRPDFFSGKIPQTLGRAEERGTIVKNDEF